MRLTEQDLSVAADVADALQVPPEWLMSVIEFETAGSFDPQIKNPHSSARGLIQFVDATARGLGYADSLDLVRKFPTFATQLAGPVYRYFKAMRPFPTEQSFYMAVFAPAYRNVSPTTLFPDTIRKVNPGIDTVQSYVDKVKKKRTLWQRVASGLSSLPRAFGSLLPTGLKKGDKP